MKINKTPKIFLKDLNSQFTIFEKHIKTINKEHQLFLKKKLLFLEYLYKNLSSHIKSEYIKSLLDSKTQTGNTVLFDLVANLFEENEIKNKSNVCCSIYSVCGSTVSSIAVTNLIEVVNSGDLLGDLGIIYVRRTDVGVCFTLELY
jgi:hypothetical protein